MRDVAVRTEGLREERAGGRVIGLVSPALAALGVPHRFTTRHSLDAPLPAGVPREACALRQVHGAVVLDADVLHAEGPWPDERPAGDALVASHPDRRLLVRVADCVPVLVAAAGGRRVAAIHAGWRGLVAGVIPAALAALDAPSDAAAVGPCLSLARFEVGDEVAAAFAAAGLADAVRPVAGARPHVDLRLAARLQLERAGVPAIDVSARCTWDDALFFSHRRDVTHGGAPTTGRQAAWIVAQPQVGISSRGPRPAGS